MTTAVLDRPSTNTAIPGIPFGRLLGVEWRKTIGTRAARWVIIAVAVATLGIMAIPLSLPGDIDQTWGEYTFFSGIGLSILLPVVLILTLTSEWSQRTALATFTQEPRRGRVLAAKLTVGLIMSVVAAALALLVSTAALAMSSGLGRDVEWGLGGSDVISLVLFTVLNVGMGMAFGALLHNSAAAIVLFYLLGFVWGILGSIGPIQKVAEWLDPNRALSYIQLGDWGGRIPEIATAMVVWFVVPLALGAMRTIRRDVS